MDATGQPDCMLQDWLGARGLDRARLSILANNAMQIETYDDWLENKGNEVRGGHLLVFPPQFNGDLDVHNTI